MLLPLSVGRVAACLVAGYYGDILAQPVTRRHTVFDGLMLRVSEAA